jgi:hypothetical protein
MNTRIAELAEQAGYPNCMTYGQDLVLERFAELIIGECTETVRQVLREEGSTLSYEDCSKIQKQMKDYFGVK